MPFSVYSSVPPWVFSVGVNSVLYPGSWIELKGYLLGFKWDSVIATKSKLTLCSEKSAQNLSERNGSEEIFKEKMWNIASV